MPRNNKQDPSARRKSRNINNLAKGIQSNMDQLYQQTYYSSPSVTSDLDTLAKDINTAIDNITRTNQENIGVPNTSKLYTRILDANGLKVRSGSSLMDDIVGMFQDTTLMDDLYESFMQNYILKEMDDEIDAVCKYMPKLLEALETRKDNVLSADHFSKDFLTITSDNISKDREFDSEIRRLKETYNLLKFAEDLYDDTAKYGEQFVYIVPYKQAMQRLLARKPRTELNKRPFQSNFREECIAQGIDYDQAMAMHESAYSDFQPSSISYLTFNGKETKILSESNVTNPNILNGTFDFSKEISDSNPFNVKIEINRTNVIESALTERFKANRNRHKIQETSLWQEAATSMSDKKKEAIAQMTDAKGSLSFDGLEPPKKKKDDYTYDNLTSYDGLVTGDYAEDPDKIKIEVPGCVLKALDHTLVEPIYMDDTCMGYYYIEFFAKEFQANNFGFTNITGDPLTAASPDRAAALNNSLNADRQDMIAKFISGQLAQFIDANFISSNQDLRNEIYVILKHNDIFNSPTLDRIKVTYIPPDEMIHVYFRKNKLTNRGISDLDRAMVPAKIYSALYITQGIGALTRGQDKRVYYVKQQVETNIARTLLNVVNQIKMGNFGMRQFKSINSVLNITGRFNDYVIPTNASGDAPIQFEVMPKLNWAA